MDKIGEMLETIENMKEELRDSDYKKLMESLGELKENLKSEEKWKLIIHYVDQTTHLIASEDEPDEINIHFGVEELIYTIYDRDIDNYMRARFNFSEEKDKFMPFCMSSFLGAINDRDLQNLFSAALSSDKEIHGNIQVNHILVKAKRV